MKHIDKIVCIRETRDYMIPIYDEEDDEEAKKKAMEILDSLNDPVCKMEKKIVSIDTKKWKD